MSSGLYYRGSKNLTIEQCCWLITVVALAAGDATALAVNGRRIYSLKAQEEEQAQWVQMPGASDDARPTGAPTIPRTVIDARIRDQELELNMLFAAMSSTPVSQPYMWLDTEMDEDVYKEIRLYYIQAFACALQCGKEWMVECGSWLSANLPDVDFGWR
ncbi:MAG: hypothetical protein M1830_010530 [Pleopsidium flavum]|nr:MAG: hypothetical protein M1830_010530 [Pleopsidium flavum]